MINIRRFTPANHLYFCLIILFLGLSSVVGVAAQDQTARPERGTGGMSTQASSQVDNINLQNGNVSLQVPLASLPAIAGGKLSYTLNAYYNSTLWNGVKEEKWGTAMQGCTPTYTTTTIVSSEDGGWKIGGQYKIIFRNASEEYGYLLPPDSGLCYGSEYTLMQGRFFKPILKMPDGSEHEMRIYGYFPTYQGNREYLKNYYQYGGANSLPFDFTVRLYTVDGTYVTATYDPSGSYAIYLKDGMQVLSVSGGGQRIKDTNGNSILFGHDSTYNYDFAKDEQTGRLIKWSQTTHNNEPVTKVEYQSVGGAWQAVWVVWGQTTVKGKYYPKQDWDIAGGPTHSGDKCFRHQGLEETFDVVREIVFPATEYGVAPQQYSFAYNSDATVQATDTVKTTCATSSSVTRDASPGLGEISQIVTPAGSAINYDFHFTGTHKIGLMNDSGSDDLLKDVITAKTIAHDGATDTWSYSIPFASTGELSSVANPDGSTYSEKYLPKDFLRSTHAGTNGLGGLTYRTIQSGKIMTEKHWTLLGGAMNAYGSSGNKISFNPVVDTEYTSLLDDTGNRVKMSAKKFEYDYNGDLTKTIEYDWLPLSEITFDSVSGVPNGVPGGATVLKVTDNSYYNSAASASDSTAYHKRTVGPTSTVLLGKSQEVTVGDGVTVKNTLRFSYDGQSYDTAPSAGNTTKASSWDDSGNQWLDSQMGYDSYGNLTSNTDPKGNTTNIYYADSTHARPTSTVVNPNNGTGAQTTSTTYDFYTGLPLTATDVNGNVSSVSYTNNLLGAVDPFGRPGTAYGPYVTLDGVGKRQTVKTYYEDSTRKTRVETDLFNEGDGLLKTRETRDQIGRTVLSEKNEDGTNNYTVFSQTVYDTQHRVVFTSNARRSASAATDGWTRTTSDALGRAIETASFSGASQPPASGTNGNWTGSAATAYFANTVIATDQAGKPRRSITNSIGQLTEIDEPDNSGQLDINGVPAQPTFYTYDVLGDLIQVTQGAQTRTFTYNSLSRLTSSANPESGTVSYQYDPNGNLIQKSQTRSGSVTVITAYSYDALNRMTQRSYSGESGYATPTVTYTYDNVTNAKGRLTKVSSSVSTNEFTAFDVLGRVISHKQSTGGTDYTMSYVYNLSGALVEETYPSSRKVKNILDDGGSISLVQSRKNSSSGFWNYADSFTYTAAGAVSSVQLGNGHWESTQFNSRLQPTQIALGTVQNGFDKLRLEYAYGQWESGTLNAAKNNGNIAQQIITVPTVGGNTGFAATQKYYYDSLNRINDATETVSSGQTWRQAFIYDRYGNRNFDEINTSTLPKNCLENAVPTVCSTDRKVINPEVNTSNNRFAAGQNHTYDSAGNATADAQGRAFIFDGENKQIEVKENNISLGKYYYDGDGKRVRKETAAETTIFVYDIAEKLVGEYSTQLNAEPQVAYLTSDSLGSPRINTNAGGAVIARHDYYPFGEEISSSHRTAGVDYDSDEISKKFTGFERDKETDLDFAQARMYSNRLGRFTSSDPLLSSGKVENPQTWNRYNYVLDNPLRYNDPLGLFAWDASAGGDATDEQLQATASNKSLSKSERKAARRALKFRARFRAAREQAREAANNPDLTDEQKTRILGAVNSYGDENDHNGVVVAIKSQLGTGNAATTELRDDGTTLVSFRPDVKGSGLAIQLAHEGQHVYDIDAFLSNREANGSTDLYHADREKRAFEITSFVAQGLGKSTAPKGFDPKYQVWNSGWKTAEVAEKRAKAIDRLVSTYYPHSEASPDKRYSQEFHPQP
jgi:RHS repeat-associated protein